MLNKKTIIECKWTQPETLMNDLAKLVVVNEQFTHERLVSSFTNGSISTKIPILYHLIMIQFISIIPLTQRYQLYFVCDVCKCCKQ